MQKRKKNIKRTETADLEKLNEWESNYYESLKNSSGSEYQGDSDEEKN